MSGDCSRDSFVPDKLFSRVLMQQGRVQLDADWNEQTSLTLDYIRTLANDLLGPGAGPAGNVGFQLFTKANLPSQPTGGTPDEFTDEERNAVKNGDALLMPGRYYVGGLPLLLREKTLYSAQAGYPFDEATGVDKLKTMGSWLAYLDVWEDYLSADQDDSIRDPALGGIDTCGRGVIRWQVRILPDAAKPDDFDTIPIRKYGRLKAFTDRGEAPDSPCIIPPDSRYRGVENQLYRVEIHRGSDASGKNATFKWSRDNGSVAYPLRDVDDELLKLVHLGRDEKLAIATGQWVELVDERWTGHDPSGPLAKVVDVRRDERSVTVEWADPKPELPMHGALFSGLRPILRRWDHQGAVDAHEGVLPVEEGKNIELEDGVVIYFEPGGTYRAGDHWLIPARVSIGDLLWPGLPENAKFQEPHGPRHFYAPLAFFKTSPGVKDLRRKFEPISKPV